jgi:hypothetical protein
MSHTYDRAAAIIASDAFQDVKLLTKDNTSRAPDRSKLRGQSKTLI